MAAGGAEHRPRRRQRPLDRAGARAAIEAGTAQLFLDGGSALQIDALEEQALRATLAQGSLYLLLTGLETFGGTVDIATPEASVATAIDSRILIEAAAPDGSAPGRITVFEGGAEVTLATSAEPIRLGPGQSIALRPGDAAPAIEPAGPPTPLMAWALGAEPRAPLPQAVRGMTGAAELAQAGRWDRSPQYGEVWYPPVAQDWVPYQDGSWEWRDPWGWTWVDAAPWGFVTAHYGRWVRIGPRWGWAPAPVPLVGLPPLRPVWAPALVTFFSPPPLPGSGRPVGWVPLGPREAWYPWYRASPGYVARVNIRQVPAVAPLRQRWVAWGGPERRWDARGEALRSGGRDPRRLDAYRNRAAATWVTDRTMLESRPVRPEARRADAALLRRATLDAGLPLRPDAETRGLTPRAAARIGLPPGVAREGPRTGAAEPPAAVRSVLTGTGPRWAAQPPRRGEAEAAPELRQRLREDQARRRGEGTQEQPVPARPAQPGPGGEAAQRRDALRQRLREVAPPDAAAAAAVDGMRRQQMDQARRLQERPQVDQGRGVRERPQVDQGRGVRERPQFDQARGLQERPQPDRGRGQPEQELRRQTEQTRGQSDQLRRAQMDQARRQQEQVQRQQMDRAQRQQEQARGQSDQMRREPMDQARRQQEQAQRQQMEQSRRQQEQAQRQQMDQARRQQEQMQRQQMDQARRQQEQAQRQQMEQSRRQQEQVQRQQMEQSRRQQEQVQRQQMEQSRRQQEQVQRQQMEQSRRQQVQAQRRDHRQQ